MNNITRILAWRRILVYALLGIMFPASFTLAVDINNIVIDNSLIGVNHNLTNGQTNTIIGQDSGVPSTNGHNLFFSFSAFNIGNGNSATFNGSNLIQNVISRVTGGLPSNIDGTLKSNIGQAAFYFINPNGITFGPNTQIEVPGAFHVSTANKIDFQSGGIFYADSNQPENITLPGGNPISLGFLATNSTNNGLIVIDGFNTNPNNDPTINQNYIGKTLDITARGITVENSANLNYPTGEIRMIAMQGPGSVSVLPTADGSLPLPTNTPSATNSGVISIDNSTLDTAGNGGGRVSIWGGTTSLTGDAEVWTDNNGFLNAGSAKGIDIISNQLVLDGGSAYGQSGNSNSIYLTPGLHSDVRSGSTGKAGDVIIQAGTLDILNGAQIDTSTRNQGQGGDIKVTVNEKLTINSEGSTSQWATGITSEAYASGRSGDIKINASTLDIFNGGSITNGTWSSGNAGNIKLVATNHLTIDSQGNTISATGIDSSAYQISSGNAGNVDVSANTLDILNAGLIRSTTAGQGNGGIINVNASNILNIDGKSSINKTGILSLVSALQPQGASGNAGKITVQAGNLDIINGGQIATSTHSQGNAGEVNVNNINTLFIDQGASRLNTGIMSISGPDPTTPSSTPIIGNAGIVNVQTKMLNIQNNGKISSASYSSGHAGVVNIEAVTAFVHSSGNISSASLGANSSGKTGDVKITASDWLHLTDGGYISTQNEANVLPNLASAIQPGNIRISALDILMQNSSITSDSKGNVAAGNITINFSHWLTMDPSFITTKANSGNGGSITINGGELINLQNSGFTTSVNGANSNGGDISVIANILLMNTGVIQANAVGGTGGNIILNLRTLIPSNDTLILGGAPVTWEPFITGFNVIQAASQAGISGSLSVTAPQLNLSGVLANIGGPQFDTSVISQDYCGLGTGSTLTRTGRGGLLPKGSDIKIY